MNWRAALRQRAPWHLLVAVLIFGLGFAATAWRLEAAPDLFTDEIVYARAGIRVAGEGALVWDTGKPIHIHPPLYFLTEAAYYQLTGRAGAPLYAAGDIFALVYHARHLNALLAGATAALLFLAGRHLRGWYLGLLLAALFVLDPFGLRTNRRAMLETLAAVLTLAGMYVFLTRTSGPRRIASAWAVVAGLFLGCAMLTKEITFTSIPALLLFGAWEVFRKRASRSSWRQRMRPFAPALLTAWVAGASYVLYPTWILGAGRWEDFRQVKGLSLQRLLGLVQITGWNRPGVSLGDFLLQRLTDYGSSYALLGLGGAATIWLLWRRHHTRDSRLLLSWGLVVYPFFVFLALFGTGNDQFFYFLLHPAILLTGYAACTVWEGVRLGRQRKAWLWAAGMLTFLLLSYNAVRWWSAYGVGGDNAYYQLRAYVRQQVPQAEPLNATGDALKFQYFFPDRLISAVATPDEARALGLSTFFLAPKDVEARFGRVRPELAAWIVDHGRLLASAEGDSYGAVYLYHVGAEAPLDGVSSSSPDLRSARPRQRRFAQAAGGFVNDLLVGLGIWIVALGALVGSLCIWHSRSSEPRSEPAPEAAPAARGGGR